MINVIDSKRAKQQGKQNIEGNKKRASNSLYTKHGRKKYQGRIVKVGGERALGYFEGDNLVAYSTLEEIRELSYSQELEDYHPDF